MDRVFETQGVETRVQCLDGLVVAKYRYFTGTRIVSAYFRFEAGTLKEKIVYAKNETLTGRSEFEKVSDDTWIVTRFLTKKERSGEIAKRELLIGYDPESTAVQKSFTAKRWFFKEGAGKVLEFIEHYDPVFPRRVAKKESFLPSGELRSIYEFQYKGDARRPISFVETSSNGQVLSSYSLDTPLSVEAVYRAQNLSQGEIEKRVAHQKRSDRFKIAIIDSGFDYNHPALADQWWSNPLDPIDGVDNDGNGWIDDNFGWDQVRDIGLPGETTIDFADRSRPLSHGTHVAHIASRGLRDVALIGFSGDYTRPEYIERISKYLKAHEVRVVNMSLGLPNDYKNTMGLKDSIKAYKKMVEDNPETLFVVASGNTTPKGLDIDVHTNRQFPANLNLPNMIVVGALDTDKLTRRKYDQYKMANYSNYGRRSVDILAAGTDVEAAALGGGLIRHSGTSMATPNMANAVARLWTKYPSLTAVEVREIFNTTAYKMKGDVPVRSGGFVDVLGAKVEAQRRLDQRRKSKADTDEATRGEDLFPRRSSASVTEDDQMRMTYLAGRSAKRGANCWNAALVSKGMSVGVHFTSASEFSFLLSSPLCKKIEPEGRESGDIVALRRFDGKGRLIRDFSEGEIHGYVYLQDDANFTKNGTSPKEKYEFKSTNEIKRIYVKNNLHGCRELGIPREHCNLRAEYYRCSSMAEFQSDFTHQPLPSQKLMLEKLALLEIRLQDIHLSDEASSANSSKDLEAAKLQIRSEINVLTKELEVIDKEVQGLDESSTTPNRETATFYADLIYYRLRSLNTFMF